jgi:hypothetical protein
MPQTATNQTGDPGAASFSKAASQVMQGLAEMYKTCHKAGNQELCDHITQMMQGTSELEATFEAGPMPQAPMDMAAGMPQGEPMPADAENPAEDALPADAEEDAATPLPTRPANSIGDAAGMLHAATMADAAKRRLNK